MDDTRVTTSIRHVDNLANPDKPWSLQWQTPIMAAPSFWYYRTEAEAIDAEHNLRTHNQRLGDIR